MEKNLRSNNNKRDNTTPLRNEAKIACSSFSPSRLETMFKRIDKQFELLTSKIKESEERILVSLNEKINDVENRLLTVLDKRVCDIVSEINTVNERVSYLETQCTEIKSLQSEIKTLKLQINRQENITVACDLRINGIPFMKNENLNDIFGSICCALNISTPAFKSIFRLQNRNNKEVNSPDAVILVKLHSPYDKNFILKSYAQFRKTTRGPLCLQHIGFSSQQYNNSKVYLNENLTSNNFKILNTAILLRKKGRLNAAFTLRGLVYIKINPHDEPIRIEDHNELNSFFPVSEGNVQNEMPY